MHSHRLGSEQDPSLPTHLPYLLPDFPKAGRGVLLLAFQTVHRGPREVRQPPQAHTALGSKVLTCQDRAA